MQDCILVTGGAGFIGSNFVLRTAGQSGTGIVNLDKLTYAACAYFSKWGWFVDKERDSINARALRQAEGRQSDFSDQLAAETE